MPAIDPKVLSLYRCPLTRSPLRQEGDWLIAERPEGAGLRYPIKDGLPQLLMELATLPDGVATLAEFKQRYADNIPQ